MANVKLVWFWRQMIWLARLCDQEFYLQKFWPEKAFTSFRYYHGCHRQFFKTSLRNFSSSPQWFNSVKISIFPEFTSGCEFSLTENKIFPDPEDFFFTPNISWPLATLVMEILVDNFLVIQFWTCRRCAGDFNRTLSVVALVCLIANN